MNRDILEEVKRYAVMKRKHASFFNWHDKRIKESGIVGDFLEPKNHNGIHDYISFNIPEADPPDALVYRGDGSEVPLEIMELVNESAIDAQIHDKPTYSAECEKWDDIRYFESELNDRIQTKNDKCLKLFNQGKEVQLLLHSDEAWVEASCERHFEKGINIKEHNFSAVWLMLSYSPKKESCTIIQVL